MCNSICVLVRDPLNQPQDPASSLLLSHLLFELYFIAKLYKLGIDWRSTNVIIERGCRNIRAVYPALFKILVQVVMTTSVSCRKSDHVPRMQVTALTGTTRNHSRSRSLSFRAESCFRLNDNAPGFSDFSTIQGDNRDDVETAREVLCMRNTCALSALYERLLIP